MEKEKITDAAWCELVRNEKDDGWRRIWEDVIEPCARTRKYCELMNRVSLTPGDLMGLLYEDLIARQKIALYRGDGSFQGWLRAYVRGYILKAATQFRDEISLSALTSGADDSREQSTDWEIPHDDREILRGEAWRLTHYCLRELWNQDPDRAYIHVLKTRFFLSSDEIKDMLELSSAANVDKIFSRSVQFMRERWATHDRIRTR